MARALTSKQVEAKRSRERAIVCEMIATYCHGNHGTRRGELCDECEELAAYARARTERCPRMAVKTFCSRCPIHCYMPSMREKIREVMRYSGPRLMATHPVMCVRHGVDTLAAKLRQKG